MTTATVATPTLDELWANKRRTWSAWYQDNINFNDARESLCCDFGIFTEAGMEAIQESMRVTGPAHEAALADLKVYYAANWGTYGTFILETFLRAEMGVGNAIHDLTIAAVANEILGVHHQVAKYEADVPAKKMVMMAARLALVALNGPYGDLVAALVTAQTALAEVNTARSIDFPLASDALVERLSPERWSAIVAAKAAVEQAEANLGPYPSNI